MKKVLIIVAGMPASGKTCFATHLSSQLQIPLVCKDRLKEIIWERMHYDGTVAAEAQKFGGLAYDLSFHFLETLMQMGQSAIFESNLGAACPPTLKTLVDKYAYRVITVMLDGDPAVIHQRFLARDYSAERHPGLVSGQRFADLEQFKRAMGPCSAFSYGDRLIRVDTTDFSQVNYETIVATIQTYLRDFLAQQP